MPTTTPLSSADSAILTRVFRSDRDFIGKREARIKEALALASGAGISAPNRHVVAKLSNGKEAFFLKPGKETARKNPNIHDMTPGVGIENRNQFERAAFDDIWEHLIQIAIINELTFKKTLTLLYRVCYFIDHRQNEEGQLVYQPKEELAACIEKIDYSLNDGFEDKFKKSHGGLLEFLHFIDLLGWNEDVKYHVDNGEPSFPPSRNNVGRINTIISVISVPLMINHFLANIMQNVKSVENINVRLILSTMQQLSKSRGVCVLSGRALAKELSPFLVE